MLAGVGAPCFGSARAADTTEIARGAAPAWLVHRDIPEARADLIAQSSSGLTWLLVDQQVRAVEGGFESYRRFATRVNGRSGLESAGALSIVFDPHLSRVTLNHVHVIREGKVIDHTADVKFDLVRREGDLENGIVDGVVTAVGNIANVRVGDIVDYSYTNRVSDELWPGHYFDTLSTRWSVPVAQSDVRITWPTARPLVLRNANTDVKFTKSRAGADTVYELIQREPPVQEEEGNVPSWFAEYGQVTVSTMADWADVAAWAVPLYRGDESLPDDLVRDLDAIAARWPKPEDRLTEATRLVQDRIRYVGVEIAEGSFVPRRPREVLRLGYGDCKDKSLLLAVALRHLGLDAVPALAATSWGRGLDQFAPSPGSFNHVIVRAELDGKAIWVDPTRSNQGGRGRAMTPPEYGFVLPIRAGQRTLERIDAFVPDRDEWHVVERYDIDRADPNAAVRLWVESIYRDNMAESMRSRMAVQPASDIAKGNLDYYLRDLPGIVAAAPLVLEDDRDGNVVRMVESYTISRKDYEAGNLSKDFNVRAYSIRGLLPAKQGAPRRNPLYVAHNERRVHVIELNVKGQTFSAMPDIDASAEGVRFQRQSSTTSGQQRMTYTLTSGQETVAAARSASLFALSDKVGDESAWTYHFGEPQSDMAERLGIDPTALEPFEARILQVGDLVQKETPEAKLQALSLLNAMAKEAPSPSPVAGMIEGMKGSLLAGMNRLAAARAAMETSAAQYQGSGEMLFLLAALQLQDHAAIKAADTLILLAQRKPEGLVRIDKDFLRSMFGTLHQSETEEGKTKADDLTIAMAQGGWQQSPRTSNGDGMRVNAIRLLADRGAIPAARKLLAVGPIAAEATATIAADKRYVALWPDVEGAVRDRFRSLLAQDVARSGKALSAEPENLELLQDHAANLRRVGQAAKAVEALKTAAADRARIEAAGTPGFWLVNEYAYDLADAGRPDDAIKELDWLVGLDLDHYPDLVSQAINRASVLNRFDRPAEALEAFDTLQKRGDAYASKYGKMWVLSGTVCAAQALGKPDKVQEAWKAMEGLAESNSAAMTQALACRGDIAALEALLIKRLDDPRERGGVLGAFATSKTFHPMSRFETTIDTALKQARARPAVQAKFQSYGRSLQFDGEPSYWGGL